MTITADRLRDVLHYDPPSGVFTWLVATSSRAKVGDAAGSLNISNGYVYIQIDGHRYLAHRLAWFYMTGSWPTAEIDHVNGFPIDNRWTNLREATSAQNQANRRTNKYNTSGFKGVIWDKHRQRWCARIGKDGRLIFLGYFDTPAAAHAAYVAAAPEHHGDFARAA